MIRCTTCGSEMLRYQDNYGVRYHCIVCGAHLNERTGTITGGRLPRAAELCRQAIERDHRLEER